MSAAGPSQGTRPLGGASRSDVRGESAAGPSQGTCPLGGASRSDVRGERNTSAAHEDSDDTRDDRAARIEELVGALQGSADDEARASARELVALVLELHGTAWAKLLALLDGDSQREALRGALLAEPAIAEILLLHGLHPDAARLDHLNGSPVPAVSVVPVSRITLRATGEKIAGARA